MGKVYRSLQGKEVDIEKLMARNELMPAIGNASVNARGDEIGPGGKIIRTKEQIMSDYYENNPKARPDPRPEAKEDTVETLDYNETLPTKRNK
jgi:hypothetical protein